MATQSAVNLIITNSADGYSIGGGSTVRTITYTGANMTLTGSGTNVYTFPASTSTLASLALAETFENKTKIVIGAAASATTRLFYVTGDVAGGVATIERANATTNAVLGTAIIKATSSGDMVDGFGMAFQFAIQDNAGVENNIGNISMIRAGADNSGTMRFTVTNGGVTAIAQTILQDTRINFTQSTYSSGSDSHIVFTPGAHTNQTASTEEVDYNFATTRTVQFATGTLSLQRSIFIGQPTYGFVGASTLTNGANLAVNGPPIGGTNATVTTSMTLLVAAGSSVGAGVATAIGLRVLPPTGATNNYGVVIDAGTTSGAPLRLTAGTNMTTAAAGVYEYDGTTSYFTRATGERGVEPSTQHITLTTAFTTAGGTTALQKLFNSPTNGTLTVAANTTFYFECMFSLTAMSASGGTFSFGIAGTANITGISYMAFGEKAAAGASAPFMTFSSAAAATVVSSSNTVTTGKLFVSGKIRITTTGTLIPSFATSVAAASIVGNDSYFKIWAAGSNTVQSVGNWS